MINILKDFTAIVTDKKKEPICYAVMASALLFCIIGFFNKELAVGFFVLLLLSVVTIFTIYETGIKDKEIYAIFLTALLVHLAAVLFIYYRGFRPFGGGADFALYDQIARDIAYRFSHGNFSLDGLYTDHFFPVVIGILYMLTFPSMIIGQLFTVWLAAFSVLLTYLIVLQIGGTKKIALLTSIIITMYPSYLYFGSVLLKDTVVVPLVLAGILLILKMGKNFSWVTFSMFFIVLTCLINLRFYIGYALMFSFIFCWPWLSVLSVKKRIIYWFIIIFLIGFSPQIANNGYYGFSSFKSLANPEKITYYREIVYNNPSLNPQPITPQPTTPKPTISKPITPPPSAPQPTTSQPTTSQPNPLQQEFNGIGSTFELETGFGKGFITFFKNSSQSFLYSLLGPFPWQLRYQRQMMGLVETIPWYILIIVSMYGFARFIKRRGILEFLKFYKFSSPLLLFGILALGALSLYINNYGIITRIRIPIFICFIAVMFISFNGDLEKFYRNHLRNLYKLITRSENK